MLKHELMQVPSTEIKKNMEAFQRKFEIQTRELTEMETIVVHEGNRIIGSVLAGSHESLIDPVCLYKLFTAMPYAHIS